MLQCYLALNHFFVHFRENIHIIQKFFDNIPPECLVCDQGAVSGFKGKQNKFFNYAIATMLSIGSFNVSYFNNNSKVVDMNIKNISFSNSIKPLNQTGETPPSAHLSKKHSGRLLQTK